MKFLKSTLLGWLLLAVVLALALRLHIREPSVVLTAVGIVVIAWFTMPLTKRGRERVERWKQRNLDGR